VNADSETATTDLRTESVGSKVSAARKKQADERAKSLGLTMSAYIDRLIGDDLAAADQRLTPRAAAEMVTESNVRVDVALEVLTEAVAALGESVAAIQAQAADTDHLRRGLILVCANLLHIQDFTPEERDRLLREAFGTK
jgi:hypothetical protein